jgi:translation elongation factor EF-G
MAAAEISVGHPSNFGIASEKGIRDAASRGYLAGYPVVDFKVELIDGSYHLSIRMICRSSFQDTRPSRRRSTRPMRSCWNRS